MKNINFIADMFDEDLKRGAELNDGALINYLSEYYNINKIKSQEVKSINENEFYIISNFVGLSQENKDKLIKYENYLIYEHDHKYTITRNPYINVMDNKGNVLPNKEGKVNPNNLINTRFYHKAKLVICLTNWHEEQVKRNITCNTDNIHGSIWSIVDLDNIDDIRNNTTKVDKCAVFDDSNTVTLKDGKTYNQGNNIKNKQGNLDYCIKNNLPYRLIPRINDRSRFLKALGKHNKFVFFPDIPETCSRIIVEAKMLGLDVITNEFSGAVHEEWFKLSGQELTDHFRNKIIPNTINLFRKVIDERD